MAAILRNYLWPKSRCKSRLQCEDFSGFIRYPKNNFELQSTLRGCILSCSVNIMEDLGFQMGEKTEIFLSINWSWRRISDWGGDYIMYFLVKNFIHIGLLRYFGQATMAWRTYWGYNGCGFTTVILRIWVMLKQWKFWAPLLHNFIIVESPLKTIFWTQF